ncbi:MAG: hypothetical protein FD129_1847 [bacterium]|nr:MAG: hypothetical protein FD129_1847 [bacterium]
MRQPDDLPRDELVSLVRDIQNLLYAEADESEVAALAPEQEWDSQTLADLGSIFGRHGLAPAQDPPDDRSSRQAAS